ncbi:hypothetical protein HMPREF1580_01095, partial [Gardnerella vaginalis JCP8070]
HFKVFEEFSQLFLRKDFSRVSYTQTIFHTLFLIPLFVRNLGQKWYKVRQPFARYSAQTSSPRRSNASALSGSALRITFSRALE